MFFSLTTKPTVKSSLFLGTSLALLAGLAAPALAQNETESVIVTGTRTTGMTAADSAAPITVVGADTLSHTGQPDLIQALAQNVPSFNAESLGGDTANLTVSARLRGLNPNDTLVLVDGKRRHTTGNLHVLSGQYQGAATADLAMIPVGAIDHIEVLQDGASAQYGTDAIAGVVNIILKKHDSGGTITATGGQTFQGDGDTYDFSGNFGFALGSKGFVNVTLEKRYHNFTQRGGQDIRIVDQNGAVVSHPYDATQIAGGNYPNVNHIVGDAESDLSTVLISAGYDLTPDLSLYANGSYGRRLARAFENVRLPDRIRAAATSNQMYLPAGSTPICSGAAGSGTAVGADGVNPCYGQSGGYTDPGEVIFSTTGFQPQEVLRENDYAYTFGAKGTLAGWAWDISSTYGKDIDDISTEHTANGSALIYTHTTPTNFYDGAFIAGQWTGNFDVNKSFEVGLASPLNVAVGSEVREDTYQIKKGDFYSTYFEGGSSYPGFLSSDAGSHSRKNYGVYFDLAASPIEHLEVDVAGRYEHYTDFGDTEVGKVTARYDFTPEFAVRGTISTGFRAPTIAEEYYSATNVGPTTAFVQLPPNSHAASLLGLSPLQPEVSTNYSFGFVAHPLDGLSATLDFYSISLKNRIQGSGTLYGTSGFALVSQNVLDAIKDHGNILDNTVSDTGVNVFVNGVSTKTQGVDLTVNYASDFDALGTVTWTLAGNYGETTLSSVIPTPAPIQPAQLFDKAALSLLTDASPKEKIGLGALWNLGDFSVNFRETMYGPTSQYVTPDGSNYFQTKVSTAFITDLELDYAFTDMIGLAIGANNLLDKTPETIQYNSAVGGLVDGSNVVDAPLGISPYGINGGFYYGKITFNF